MSFAPYSTSSASLSRLWIAGLKPVLLDELVRRDRLAVERTDVHDEAERDRVAVGVQEPSAHDPRREDPGDPLFGVPLAWGEVEPTLDLPFRETIGLLDAELGRGWLQSRRGMDGSSEG